MRYFIALLIVILATFGLVFFKSDEQHSDAPLTGLPWQIDKLTGGDTQVFGITLGRTTLGEAIELLGDDLDLAIIAAPHEAGVLEAYYSRYSAGPITGKLILMMGIAPETLLTLRKRAFKDGGTRKYHLHPDDLPFAYRAPVRVITFLPSLNLDKEIIQARFGIPAEIIPVHSQQQHLLYPEKGLDIILNTDNKEVLQYLSPDKFSAHRMQLQKASTIDE